MTTATTTARRVLADQLSGRANRAFYVAVLAVALTGSAIAAEDWLHWWFLAALGAVALAELGGIALSVFADRRRQLGERAIFARMLSAGVAAGAVAINYLGHGDNQGAAFFFAGFSLLGYLVWLIDSAARRRDALRKAGKLAETPPAYGAWQWARHPFITRRARALFLINAETRLTERLAAREAGHPDAEPTTVLLGRLASLQAAVAEVRLERRLAAIDKALRSRIAASVDPTMADLAVNTYDVAEVARRLEAGADYAGLTALIARELVPDRIAAGRPAPRWWSLLRSRTARTAPAPIAARAETAWPITAPAGTRLLPIVPAVGPVRPAAETPQTVTRTARGPVVPAGARPLPIVARSAPVRPAVETARTAPTAAPTADEVPATNGHGAPADVPTMPAIPEKLHPMLRKVMAGHRDWHLTVGMPPRHPDALNVPKIMAAADTRGKQYGVDLRTALLALAHDPAGAERHVGLDLVGAGAAVTEGN